MFVVIFFSCNKEVKENITKIDPVLVDESTVLKPVGGYSLSKRSDDYIASMERGKPVKNNVENITSLMTTVKSPYQIDLNWYGVRSAVSYNIYRDNILIVNTNQPFYSDHGLTPNTKYKYQVAGVASNGTVGSLSNIAYGTTFSTDIGSKVIVYLSFNGDTTNSSYWTPYSGGLPLITGPSGFTEDEKQLITDSVAKDLAQFPNIKVTRNKAEYDAAGKARRHKTIFTQDYVWYSGPTPTAGGVSYLDVFGLDIPSYVFTSALYYNPRYCWIADTHEIGHAIGGLHHAVDCCNCGQSYGGDGNHMGAAYHQAYRFFNNHLIGTCGKEDQVTILNDRTK